MQHSKWQWTRPPARKTDTIPWYFFVSLGLFCGMVVTQVSQLSHARHASREVRAAREDVEAHTITLAPQERMQITLSESGYTFTAPVRSYYGAMDPSCQVYRQQQEQGQVVWRGEPRVVTHNGVVSAVVTNESIVELPESEQQALDTVKISHR